MNKNKESLGLTLKNNGPNINGYYEDLASQSLYLESYQPIKHQTNWDSGLTSLENTNKESFQNFGATNYLGFNNQVSDIQIIDDLAFISYGNYTDINKTVTTYKNANLILPYMYTVNTSYDFINYTYKPVNGYCYLDFLTTFNIRNKHLNTDPDLGSYYDVQANNLLSPKCPIDLSNLFLHIRYNGTLTNSYSSIIPNFSVSNLKDRSQIFSYRGGFQGQELQAGEFNDDNGLIVYSEEYIPQNYYENSLCLNTGLSPLFPAVHGFPTRKDIEVSPPYQFLTLSISCDVSLIKYMPVSHCGKVDILRRKTGTITGFTSEGYMVSTAHDLQNGDIVRISSVLNQDLNGVKFVQVLDSNTCILYENKDFTERSYSGEYKPSGGNWTSIGNVYSVENNQWRHKLTITSPDGRNRYGSLTSSPSFIAESNITSPATTGYLSENILPVEINGVANYKSLLEKDYDINLSNASLPILNNINNEEDNVIGISPFLLRVNLPLYKNKSNIRIRIMNRGQFIRLNGSEDDLMTDNNDGLFETTVNENLIGDFDYAIFRVGVLIQTGTLIRNAGQSIVDCDDRDGPIPSGGNTGGNIGTARPNEEKINSVLLSNLGIIKEREIDKKSSLDNWQLGIDSYVNNFRFGCSIDVKKHNNKYYILVGERGPQTGLSLEYLNLPIRPLCGQSYLFEINTTLDVSLTKIYKASLDPQVAAAQNSCKNQYTVINPFQDIYQQLYNINIVNYADTVSVTNRNIPRRIEFEENYQYWYGAMLMHLRNNRDRPPIVIPGSHGPLTATSSYVTLNNNSLISGHGNYYNALSSRRNYFLDVIVPRFVEFNPVSLPDGQLTNEYSNNIINWTYSGGLPLAYYPYIDSFGKSVALDIVNGNFHVFCSSKSKPNINRPEQGLVVSQITNDTAPIYTDTTGVLSSTSSGYIHFFNNYHFIQKFYEDGITTPSRRWRPQYHRAEQFAKKMIAKDNRLIFGFTKPIEFIEAISDQQSSHLTEEKSKIIFYQYNGAIYTKLKVLENRNHRKFYLNNSRNLGFNDHKEIAIKNRTSLINGHFAPIYYPPDNFGSHFKYSNGLLLTNAYDHYNEFNIDNGIQTSVGSTTLSYYDSLNYIDYLQVYEEIDDSFIYRGKISACFNSNDTQYSYADILEPTLYKSLKSFGNYNYNNTTTNSKTWDILLNGRYDIIDDRIILKDPLGYAIFQKNASEKLNRRFQCIFNKSAIIDDDPDFIQKKSAITGRLRHTNPIISFSKTGSSATNDNRAGNIHKSYSSAYDILSSDNYFATSSFFTTLSNLDIHPHEFLSIYIKGSQDGYSEDPNTDLFLKVNEYSKDNLNLITKGSKPESFNLVILNTAYIESGLDLYLNNDMFNYSNLFLKTLDFTNYQSSINLYTIGKDGNETSSNNINLFLKTVATMIDPVEYFDGTTLVMIGPDKVHIDNSAPLFIAKYVRPHDNSLDLEIYGSIIELPIGTDYNDNVNLFLRNFNSDDNNAPLYLLNKGILTDQDLLLYNTQSIIPYSDSADLFISTQNTLFNIPLFLQVNDLKDDSSDLDLFIYGSTSSVTFGQSDSDLVISGTEYASHDNSVPLFIQGPFSIDSNNSAPLYLSNYLMERDKSVDLILYGSINETNFGDPSSGVSNLYIRSAHVIPDSNLSLFLNRKGIGGGEELEGNSNIYIKSEFSKSELDLIMNSAYVDENGVNLYMADGVGISPQLLNLFIRGFKE
jgi:hypothetical protein